MKYILQLVAGCCVIANTSTISAFAQTPAQEITAVQCDIERRIDTSKSPHPDPLEVKRLSMYIEFASSPTGKVTEIEGDTVKTFPNPSARVDAWTTKHLAPTISVHEVRYCSETTFDRPNMPISWWCTEINRVSGAYSQSSSASVYHVSGKGTCTKTAKRQISGKF